MNKILKLITYLINIPVLVSCYQKPQDLKELHFTEVVSKAENGDDKAQFFIAEKFHSDKEYQKAYTWAYKSAANNNMEAMSLLAMLYAEGKGVETDIDKAFILINESVKTGSPDAFYIMGLVYSLSSEENKSTRVKYWYQKAAGLNQVDAMKKLARMYESGDYEEQNFQKAKEWYEKAARLGDCYSMNKMGYFYTLGYGTQQNHQKAKEWYSKADSCVKKR